MTELQWWETHLTNWNGRSLILPPPTMTIETDASTIGWGAAHQGTRTGGPWSNREKRMHINCLELLAATLAIKCFARDKTNIAILLKVDNTTAISYINKLGGTVSPQLNQLTRDLWLWCMDRNITLKAVHLAGKLNVTADEESRVMKDRTDWMLCPKIFHKINRKLGPLQVDLFASRLTTQLPHYASWRPDPEAMACDAFSLDWSQMKGYANPPWNLIGKVLSQVRSQQTTLVIVTPLWKVPSTTGHVNRDSTPSPREDRSHTTDSQSQPTGHNTTTSRVDYLWERYRDKCLSEEASQLLLASWRSKSSKSYDSLFTKWASWCNKRGTDSVSGDIIEVVNFLAHLFNKGYQYRSLNSYRSAIIIRPREGGWPQCG